MKHQWLCVCVCPRKNQKRLARNLRLIVNAKVVRSIQHLTLNFDSEIAYIRYLKKTSGSDVWMLDYLH